MAWATGQLIKRVSRCCAGPACLFALMQSEHRLVGDLPAGSMRRAQLMYSSQPQLFRAMTSGNILRIF